jgi:DNA-binding NtrC family response regulator
VEEFEHLRLENEKYHLGDKRGRPSRSDSIYWHPAIFRQHYAEAVASLPENCRGDIDVAVAMGIDRKELYDLLKKHGIPRKHGAKRGRPRKSPAKNRHKS